MQSHSYQAIIYSLHTILAVEINCIKYSIYSKPVIPKCAANKGVILDVGRAKTSGRATSVDGHEPEGHTSYEAVDTVRGLYQLY